MLAVIKNKVNWKGKKKYGVDIATEIDFRKPDWYRK